MAYQELNNVSSLTQLFTYPSLVFPQFYSLVLFSLFFVVTSSSYFSQRRLTGEGDFLSSLAVASWLTMVVASVMYLIPGMIAGTTLIICIGVTILTTVLLLLGRN